MLEKFETLHRNHKLAYLDGFLCGLLAMHVAKQAAEEAKQDRRLRAAARSKNRRMYNPKSL